LNGEVICGRIAQAEKETIQMIKEITDDSGLKESVEVIRDSFITVANDLGLNKDNCPSNPAFISLTKLMELRKKGIRMFGLVCDDRQVGFVAIEKSGDAVYYMEKLAVLPGYRHRGFGKQLMDFMFDYVKKENGKKVSVGIINENTVLKNWYRSYGFMETGTRRLEHLPFLVCFMEKNV
jgi:ribosomal protein S18 acetylase RimI-like enzyme